MLKACGLSVFEFDHLVDEQKPFGRYVTGTFASPVVDLKAAEGSYPEWLRATYPGLAKTVLKKERRWRATTVSCGSSSTSGTLRCCGS